MAPIDPNIKSLQDSIFLEKVAKARRTPMSEKLVDGAILFDHVSSIMRDCIRGQFPEFTEEQVEKEFVRRLKIKRRLDERGIYQQAGFVDE